MAEQRGSGIDVLVVGAGPTGLVMASELARHGVRCRIIDEAAGPSEESKALTVQSRTLEVFEDMGLAEEVISRGSELRAMNSYAGGERIMRLSFEELESPYPFVLCLPQNQTERILARHLRGLGIGIEWGLRLEGLTQDEEGVEAQVTPSEDDAKHTIRARWLVGCDGARSTVRRLLELPFEGEAYEEGWLLADVQLRWEMPGGEAYLFLAEEGVLLAIPIGEDVWRLIATAPEARSEQNPKLEEFRSLIDARAPSGAALGDPVWLSAFKISRRLVSGYRGGRVFLAGDAAHIHSPAGGQGMNTGIQDAYNLAWKLALVIRGHGKLPLLESYEAERMPVARNVLRGTDLLNRLFTLRNPLAQRIRNLVQSLLADREAAQQRMRQTFAELRVNYRNSPIVGEHRDTSLPDVEGAPGMDCHEDHGNGPTPGERAPDAMLYDPATGTPTQLFEILRGTRHNLLLLGGVKTSPEEYRRLREMGETILEDYDPLIAVCLIAASDRVPEAFGGERPTLLDPELSLHRRYGAGTNGLYLIRPDGYVGFRSRPANGEALHDHLRRIFVRGASERAP